jgi:hypothetical protein
MNNLFAIFFPVLLITGCVKPPSKDPVPHIEFLDLADPKKSTFTNSDTATIVLSYEDGDGDLFVDNFSDGSNLVLTTYGYNESTGKFLPAYDLSIKDTVRYTNTIKQPDNGYYKGRAIRGEIFVPLNEFRESEDVKILKFTVFMVDKKNNKSNIATSPVYTLNF